MTWLHQLLHIVHMAVVISVSGVSFLAIIGMATLPFYYEKGTQV